MVGAERQVRQERWTASGVRLRQVTSGGGRGNWLFVPGGPGLGSESLHPEAVRAAFADLAGLLAGS
ncbi:hypothetical protein ACFTZI_09405 [Streptomyces decoyicus]|uniref:hypothetical protein n=1 Tax=Streptomyces decoyicus TaxID=249567 RepID=UPI00363971CB